MWNMSGAPHGNHVDIIQAIAERNIPFITLIMWTLPRQTWALYIPRKGKFHIMLDFVDSPPLRQNVQRALNRGENYHQLRRAVSYANFGKLRFKSEEDQVLWSECSRLITNSIIFYNAM